MFDFILRQFSNKIMLIRTGTRVFLPAVNVTIGYCRTSEAVSIGKEKIWLKIADVKKIVKIFDYSAMSQY